MERPKRLPGFTERIKTHHGNLYLTVNEYDGKIYEIFGSFGLMNPEILAQVNGLCRVISISLQNGTPVDDVIRMLRGISSGHIFETVKSDITGEIIARSVHSIPDAIACILLLWKKEREYLTAQAQTLLEEGKILLHVESE